MKKVIIDKIKELGIVSFGKYILKSGIESNIYFDMRSIISYPKLMADVCLMISQHIPKGKYVITGVPSGAIPFSSIVSQLSNLPLITIRDSKKEYGLGKLIEGRQIYREVILLEDVVSTGASTLQAIKT